MSKIIKLTPLMFVLILISSCKALMNDTEFKNNQNKKLDIKKEQIEVEFSCEEDGISKYTDDGWVIVEEYSEEKICSWKTFPATKNCNIDKDKGCKITKPDKIGKEKIYLLER
tara:strand:+ start:38 stop:376 length:339 start_codon:yes stop_codon:yes gene_type:complete